MCWTYYGVALQAGAGGLTSIWSAAALAGTGTVKIELPGGTFISNRGTEHRATAALLGAAWAI